MSLFVLLMCVFAHGQGGVATGDLHITVKDPKGEVTNANVTAKDVAKGLERAAIGDGRVVTTFVNFLLARIR